ncbi:unnamed protein product [Lota lota]
MVVHLIVPPHPRMDDDEEDVFEPDSYLSRTTIREIKCKDRGTQTPGPALVRANGMLPCGGVTEPRPHFYENAGFRLHFPAPFEQGERRQDMEPDRDAAWRLMQRQRRHHHHHHHHQQGQPPALSVEAHIGQKLRLIGDQFHGENLQQFHRNQRNQGGVWWRLALALLNLLFDRDVIAGWGGAGRSFEARHGDGSVSSPPDLLPLSTTTPPRCTAPS